MQDIIIEKPYKFVPPHVGNFLPWPSIQAGMERVAIKRDLDNMREIARALNAYSDRYGTYPPPVVTDAAGKPLFSWRVLILPFLGYEDLYKQFDLDQSWDSPVNSKLLSRMPQQYASPNSLDAKENFECNYVLITGAGTLFPASGPLNPNKITDKPTILLIETNNGGCIWSQPGDVDIGLGMHIGKKPLVEIGSLHSNYIAAVTTEEESLKLPNTVPRIVLDALVSPNSGEPVQAQPFMQ
jgi:hypothetical protein